MLVEHLFRAESGKMIAVLTRIYGFDRLEDIENAVQETFLSAFSVWKLRGVPDEPTAWLYRVAKNRMINLFQRDDTLAGIIEKNKSVFPVEYLLDAKFEEGMQTFEDSLLAMLYTVCHPRVQPEGRVALALKTLCGFSVPEIARAFLTSPDTIEKRLYRARRLARTTGNTFLELPTGAELSARTASVLLTLYLLFNEGYHSAGGESVVRKDLCREALRLALLIVHHPATADPEADALVALFAFHTSRFAAREGPAGDLLPFLEQNRDHWSPELVKQGRIYLHRSMRGFDPASGRAPSIGRFHLEAKIAGLHLEPDTPDKWRDLTLCYDALLRIHPGPVTELSRLYVYSRVHSKAAAVDFARRSSLLGQLTAHPLYHALFAYLLEDDQPDAARDHWRQAAERSTSPGEKKIFENRARSVRIS